MPQTPATSQTVAPLPSALPKESLHKNAFWLYGVIVGLAIKDALSTVVPHLSQPGMFVEALRLLVFLFLIIRFYLGSAYFFEVAYTAPEAPNNFPSKNYLLDFLFGLIHFIIFFAWALYIDFQLHQHAFLILLWIILLYDLAWFLVCRKNSTVTLMKLWCAINIVTFLLSSVLFLLGQYLNYRAKLVEGVAVIPVLVFSIIDMAELVFEKRYCAEFLVSLAARHPEST